MITMSSTSKLMRAAMEKHGLSIAKLANKIGVSRTYASLVIHDKRRPSARFTMLVQRLLQMPPSDIWKESFSHDTSAALYQPESDYLSMNLGEIEKHLILYSSSLPKCEDSQKLITLSVLRQLVEALRIKVKKNMENHDS